MRCVKLDGTDKRTIANTYWWGWRVKDNAVYYSTTKGYAASRKSEEASAKWSAGKNCKVYQCTNLGKNKTAITGWVTQSKAEQVLDNQ